MNRLTTTNILRNFWGYVKKVLNRKDAVLIVLSIKFQLCVKRCPYLRTYLTELIRSVWLSGSIPSEWKKACTVLIYKNGDTSIPSNFRPITLESNNFIEHNIQKGFTPNLSGTLEHTAQMANTINKAKIKQRSLVITLLDLKNAFEEVHHNLILSVLGYNYIQTHINKIETYILISKPL